MMALATQRAASWFYITALVGQHKTCIISNLCSLEVWPGCARACVLLGRVCFLAFSSFCSLPVSLAHDFLLSSQPQTSNFWVHVFHHTFIPLLSLPNFKWVILYSQIIESSVSNFVHLPLCLPFLLGHLPYAQVVSHEFVEKILFSKPHVIVFTLMFPHLFSGSHPSSMKGQLCKL